MFASHSRGSAAEAESQNRAIFTSETHHSTGETALFRGLSMVKNPIIHACLDFLKIQIWPWTAHWNFVDSITGQIKQKTNSILAILQTMIPYDLNCVFNAVNTNTEFAFR